MIKKVISGLLTILLVACTPFSSKSGWIETTGTITESTQMPDKVYAYTIRYFVTQSTAINAQNEVIKGNLSQHIFGGEKLVLSGQKIKLRYRVDNPMNYQLLAQLKYQ